VAEGPPAQVTRATASIARGQPGLCRQAVCLDQVRWV